jgi:single-strand DNA-binding protein
MFNVNRVTLLGNVTHDPDIRSTKDGRPVSAIGFATNRSWRNAEGVLQKEPEFHRLVCFGPLADFAEKRVAKGAPLYVEGRLHTSRFESRKGGKQSRTEIIVDRLVLLSSRKVGEADAAESEGDVAGEKA